MFVLDWAAANLNGATTLTNASDAVGVTIATPLNAEGKTWALGEIDGDPGAVRSADVREPTEISVVFDAPVRDLSFELYDVDAGPDWDDRVTLIALDADGNEVPVLFSDTEPTHQIDGNVIEGEGFEFVSIEGPGAADTVTVTIPGPIVSLTILHNNGEDFSLSGTVGLSDLSFALADGSGPALDGIVEGTDFADVIDVEYRGDPEGDRVDNADNIDPTAPVDDDVIEAGGGDDTIDAGRGSDTVDGGTGNDVIVTGALGRPDLGYPGLFAADEDPEDDRDFADGGEGDDEIRTGDDRDTILGGAGNDTIDGGFDADEIDGGDGADEIIGGEGSDTILGGAGNDTIFAGIGAPDDPINIKDDGSDPFGPDLVTNNGRDVVDGGAGDDRIFGEDDDDTLLGGIGSDLLDGGIDDDVLDGGADNDTLLGGQGDDTLLGQSGDDSLVGGDGDDSLEGGAGDDTLIGGEGDDTLEGRAGNDFFNLSDSGGRDLAIGGDDRDTFVSEGPGDEVVVGGEGGDDFDVLDLRGAGPLRVNFSNNDPSTESGTVDFLDPNGNVIETLTFAEIEQVIPCFTPGSRVATPKGEVAVEDLEVGDKVLTRDNGVQTIEWVGHKFISGNEMAADPKLRPILIRAGSLGAGLPVRDMMVSPNHRMLNVSDRNMLYFEEREVLVAAKHLVDGRGVTRAGVEGATYIHFMCAEHQVVLADGAWTESFQPGDHSLAGLDTDQRTELLTIFPELGQGTARGDYLAARRTLRGYEAQILRENG